MSVWMQECVSVSVYVITPAWNSVIILQGEQAFDVEVYSCFLNYLYYF